MLKSIFLASFLVSMVIPFVANATVCNEYSAQVVGVVEAGAQTRDSETQKVSCVFKIKTSYVAINSLCPLDKVEIEGFWIQDPKCQSLSSNVVSGVITKTGETLILE